MAEAMGIFGGTFDPPHLGHLAAAVCCREALGLDRVLFVVANDPWQKSPDRQISPAEDRLAMVRAAVAGIEGLEACDLEVRRGGASYTVDTVRELEASEGVSQPWVIVGSDLSTTLDTWERAEELAAIARIAVITRPGSPVHLPVGWDAVAVPIDEVDISSSMVRGRLAMGLGVADLVPPAVMRHIEAKHLYIEKTDGTA